MQLKNICTPFQWGVLDQLIYHWEHYLGEEFASLERFLYPTDELSTFYPFDPETWHVGYKVKTEPGGRIVGVVEGYPHRRIELTKRDIIEFRFDLQCFRREMGEGFGLKPQTGEISKWDRDIPWGNWEPEKGMAFPITLFLGCDGVRTFRERVMERIFKREAVGEIILTPGRSEWTGDVVEVARKNKLLLVPLNEIIQMEDGKLFPTPAWEEYLTAFCKMVEMDLPSRFHGSSPISMNEFRKKGDMWVVRYDGKEGFLKDSVGAKHLSNLFSKPGESVFAVDLQLIGSDYDPKTASPATGIELGDRQSIREIEERSRTLLAELDQAQNEGYSILEDEIRDEIEKLADYLCQVKGLGGRLRKGNDNADSIRRSVQQGGKRTLESLDDDLPDFVKHCRQSISFGFVLRYDPAVKIQWEL